MSTAARRARGQQPKSWWSSRRNRTRLWAALAIGGIIFAGALLWVISQGSSGVMNEGSVPVGTSVNAVSLEDSRNGQMFDLGQYIGKRDTVIVAYMGDFCLGCSELVAELERRAPDFAAADANLVLLGSETGQKGKATAAKHSVTSYPLLQEGSPHAFTKSIGMWSDMMAMPFMGYVIVDKSGKIVGGEQTSLSEARGAAQANVDQLLAALSKARAVSAEDAGDGANTRLAAARLP